MFAEIRTNVTLVTLVVYTKVEMKKLTGSFRYTQWDPWLIISQILSVQSILYVTLGLFLTTLGFLIGDSRSLDHIFEYHVCF